MKKDKTTINGFLLDCYTMNTLVIGSGAASLNAAVQLHGLGITDVIIATSQWGGGTSNNAGSDKQTYYKLSLSGSTPDSVAGMAKDLYSGHCMHGDIALCEAQGSVQAFMHLVELGVKFPHDIYGSFPGYRTDHDPHARATSAGPKTSRSMFEALAGKVLEKNIRVLDRHHVIALLTDKQGSKVTGALAINMDEKDYRNAFVLFNSVNIILGTGGPAGLYESSVYPLSQSGSTGMAFEAGASGQNLSESQFGIASLKFRWNLSGSYQQAIPGYFSTDEGGKDRREFLNEFFPDFRSRTKAIFLKGYQWPFDPRKIKGYGSSCIDLLVDREINERHRKVYLDYSTDPVDKESFSKDNLDPEVSSYLLRSGALRSGPVERLKALNTPAYNLFREHGIDLGKEPLGIAVCAQHNNGGLTGNIWWESDLKHLFPVGEVNGTHGVYRPGGAALNSGQVGSYRAALYISSSYAQDPEDIAILLSESGNIIAGKLQLAEQWISRGPCRVNERYLTDIQRRMSSVAGISRRQKTVIDAAGKALEMKEKFAHETGAGSVDDLCNCFQVMDHCISQYIYLSSINYYLENGGRSRGSYIVTNDTISAESDWAKAEPVLCDFRRRSESCIIEVNYKDKIIRFKAVKPRGIPVQDLWFEKVWKEYLKDI